MCVGSLLVHVRVRVLGCGRRSLYVYLLVQCCLSLLRLTPLCGSSTALLTEAEFTCVNTKVGLSKLCHDWTAMFSQPIGFQGRPYCVHDDGSFEDLAPNPYLVSVCDEAFVPVVGVAVPVPVADAAQAPQALAPGVAVLALAAAAAAPGPALHSVDPFVCWKKGNCNRFLPMVRQAGDEASSVISHAVRATELLDVVWMVRVKSYAGEHFSWPCIAAHVLHNPQRVTALSLCKCDADDLHDEFRFVHESGGALWFENLYGYLDRVVADCGGGAVVEISLASYSFQPTGWDTLRIGDCKLPPHLLWPLRIFGFSIVHYTITHFTCHGYVLQCTIWRICIFLNLQSCGTINLLGWACSAVAAAGTTAAAAVLPR